jgi:hypothetical protein
LGRLYCRLIFLVLLAVTISSLGAAHAQATSSIVITVNPRTINATMNSRVTGAVYLTNADPANSHTVTLLLRQETATASLPWPQTYFTPETITISQGKSATSTLTIAVPDMCPGRDSTGPFSLTYTIEAREGEENPWSSPIVGSTPLVVNIDTSARSTPSVSLASSKASYNPGETVGLVVNASVPIGYWLTVRKPNNATWASWYGVADPSTTLSQPATTPAGEYAAELEAYYCGTWHASASFSVVSNTYNVNVTLAGLPAKVTAALRVDGSKVADMKSDEVQILTYPNGTTHTFDVDQYVSYGSGYYCQDNVWTTAAQASHVFNYVASSVTTTSVGTTSVSTTNVTTTSAAQTILPPSTSRIFVSGGDMSWLLAIVVGVLALIPLAALVMSGIPGPSVHSKPTMKVGLGRQAALSERSEPPDDSGHSKESEGSEGSEGGSESPQGSEVAQGSDYWGMMEQGILDLKQEIAELEKTVEMLDDSEGPAEAGDEQQT